MEERRARRWSCAAASAGVAIAAALASAPSFAVDRVDTRNVRLVNIVEKAAVARAMDGAGRRLSHPECQALLDEFTDATGRPLRAALESAGTDALDYLQQVFFYDAPPRACAASALAVTTPGSRAVLVCGSRFARQAARDPRRAEGALIHEALHSLGLGENPPSSDRIDERVRARCTLR